MASGMKQGTPLPELLPDPFAGLHTTLQTQIAQAIQEDGIRIDAAFDDGFAQEIADAIVAAFEYDEAEIDMLSLAFEGDVQRALAA